MYYTAKRKCIEFHYCNIIICVRFINETILYEGWKSQTSSKIASPAHVDSEKLNNWQHKGNHEKKEIKTKLCMEKRVLISCVI